MDFTQEQLSKIPHILSEPRFTTYLKHSDNDRELALRLYQWNLEISASLIVPLHLLEVTLRNAVIYGLASVHTENWAWNKGFIRTLPNPQKGYSPQRNLLEEAKRQPTIGKVVAELKFAFWQRMFTSRHDGHLWNHHLLRVFPNAPCGISVLKLRSQIYHDVGIIREVRNRIAHHEPIFTRDIASDYERMRQIVALRDESTALWLNQMQDVTRIISLKPTL
jgi:hypothetical protein